MAFYGSVGWWVELPKAHEITDVSKYFEESDNIPCKQNINKIETEDVPENKSQEPINSFNFKF